MVECGLALVRLPACCITTPACCITLFVQMDMLDGGVDVLIATPGRLLNHHERGSLKLSNTAALVLDEVDVLAGEGADRTLPACQLAVAGHSRGGGVDGMCVCGQKWDCQQHAWCSCTVVLSPL